MFISAVGLMFFASIVFCFAGYAFTNWDEFKKYKLVLDGQSALDSRLDQLAYANQKLKQNVEANNLLVNQLQHEVEELHRHCEKLQSGQLELDKQVATKRPIIQFRGAIPVEIHTNDSMRAVKKAGKLNGNQSK